MKVNIKRIFSMVKEYINGKMEENMMVSGMKAICIEKVNFHGQTDNRMKENMSMILSKALEYFNSPMI